MSWGNPTRYLSVPEIQSYPLQPVASTILKSPMQKVLVMLVAKYQVKWRACSILVAEQCNVNERVPLEQCMYQVAIMQCIMYHGEQHSWQWLVGE